MRVNQMPPKPTTGNPTPPTAGSVAPGAAAPDGVHPPSTGKAKKKPQPLLLCPYCGEPTPVAARCGSCRGLLDALSRQASQNAMGPWFIHDSANPFRPGCSYETVVSMAKRGKIDAHTIIRGPTTHQFWCASAATPGVSHLLGLCHQCQADVQTTDHMCDDCGADFTIETDRQHLGLNPFEALPGQAGPAGESGVVSSAVLTKGPGASTPGVATDDLNAAINVLSRRLVGQTRLVNILATAVIAMLVTIFGLGVWLTADRAARINLGNLIAAPGSVGDEAAGSGTPPSTGTPVGPSNHVDGMASVGSTEPATGPVVATTPKPEAEPPAPAVPASQSQPPPHDPIEKEISELISKDTIESLSKALTLLPAPVNADAPATGRRRAVELRLQQLRLRGLR